MTAMRLVPPLRALVPSLLLGAGLAACTSGIAVRTGNPPLDPRPTGRDSALMALRATISGLIDAPQFANAHWGVLVLDPTTGDTVFSRNAGKLFMPASNQKIITGAVALARLGPAWRWRTPVVATGPVVNGVLRGDLTIAGSGDPSVSDRVLGDAMLPLRAVADSLAARGVRRIAGRVLAVGDAFPDSTHGFGWAWDDFEYGYSAGVDELLFNEGVTRLVVVASSRAGERPALTVRPAVPDVPVRVEATTIEAPEPSAGGGEPRRRTRAVLEAVREASGAIVVSGAIPVGDSATLAIVHRDPSAAFLAALRQALAEKGIQVEGKAEVPTTPASDTVAVITSPTLAEIMPAFEKPSQNQIGEMLFKTLGRHGTGVGTADSGRRVVEQQLATWGIQPYGFVVRDGSGLSRHDYVSPATLVQVLEIVRRDSALAAAFIPSLPVAGVDGTLASRMRGTPAAGNARAKTGYIDRARSLSGYVTSKDGRTLVFSLLANNWTTPLREIERVQDEIVTRLASIDLGPIPPKR